ncbi:MAG: lysophospholipase [Silicimonas sp.]|nr:lysophospholipase [Silicimonas sp.]
MALVAFSGNVAAAPACAMPQVQRLQGQGVQMEEAEVRWQGADGALAASLRRPAAGRADQVVLMLHGYTGTRDEFPVRGREGRFFEQVAEALAAQGIASVRFDFRGSGESAGRWADTTFDSQVADLRRAVTETRRMAGLDRAQLVLLGFSQGGLVALRGLADGVAADALVLWNPVLDPRATYGGLLGADALAEGARLARAGQGRAMVGRTGLRAAFFAQLEAARPVEDGAGFPGPVLVVSGRRDQVAGAGPKWAETLRTRRGARPTQVVTLEADHGFGARRGGETIDDLIACTLRFLDDI